MSCKIVPMSFCFVKMFLLNVWYLCDFAQYRNFKIIILTPEAKKRMKFFYSVNTFLLCFYIYIYIYLPTMHRYNSIPKCYIFMS